MCGSTRLGEALAIVVRLLSELTIQKHVVRMLMLAKSQYKRGAFVISTD